MAATEKEILDAGKAAAAATVAATAAQSYSPPARVVILRLPRKALR